MTFHLPLNMTCTHCGATDSDRYTLRFSSGDQDDQRVKLYLCDECIEQFLAEGNAELVSPDIIATDEYLSDRFCDSYR